MNSTLAEELENQQRFLWARSVDHSEYNSVLGHYQAQEVLRHARGNSLLDLACGDGCLTEKMAPRFNRVVAIDASPVHLDRARKRLPDVVFRRGLLEDPGLDEKFDTVTMLLVLEHVVDPQNALRSSARHLERDGVLIVHVPNANAINRRIAVKMGTLENCEELSPFDINVAGHRRFYTLESLRKEFEDAGLKVISTGGIFYKMLSTAQIDWFLKNGLWDAGFGWGRVGAPSRDWKAEFCRACYEIGKERPEDCNIIYAVGMR